MVTRKPATTLHPSGEPLSYLLASQPPGKYIVTGCQVFAPDTTPTQRQSIIRLEVETPAHPARSDPGSLTVGEPVVPQTAGPLDTAWNPRDNHSYMTDMASPVYAHHRQKGLPMHVPSRAR